MLPDFKTTRTTGKLLASHSSQPFINVPSSNAVTTATTFTAKYFITPARSISHTLSLCPPPLSLSLPLITLSDYLQSLSQPASTCSLMPTFTMTHSLMHAFTHSLSPPLFILLCMPSFTLSYVPSLTLSCDMPLLTLSSVPSLTLSLYLHSLSHTHLHLLTHTCLHLLSHTHLHSLS